MMLTLTPALGVPNEEMLQDTLKSMVAAIFTLLAALFFFWQQRNRRDGLRWHAILWFPVLLLVYSLGSMVWSHTYLAGGEAIRWFIFSAVAWLILNISNRQNINMFFAGIHWGAFVAAIWGLLQFYFDFNLFAQGPNPGSTFINRNFFAEFLVCTVAFSFYLLANARNNISIIVYASTTALNIIALFSTGTRSALVAFQIEFIFIIIVAILYRNQFSFKKWSAEQRIIALAVFFVTLLFLGLMHTQNPKIIAENDAEGRGLFALQRAFKRTSTVITKHEYTVGSFSVRLVMWRSSLRMMAARPWSGVGAGAWEADIPLYQESGQLLETDYYAHNEILQLIAEFGLVGWLALLGLLIYLIKSAWYTWRHCQNEGAEERPLRATLLVGILTLLIVSNAGFPWRMASTALIFAVCLGMMAASDARLKLAGPHATSRIKWQPAYSEVATVFFTLALVLALYISQQAAECESRIVRATKMALTISQSGDANNPKWDKQKKEMLILIKEGIDINPHYRKITPMVADELSKWGDWKNALWIWESVIASRPYVIGMMQNAVFAAMQLGQFDKAMQYVQRIKKMNPNIANIRAAEVILLSRTGHQAEARLLAIQYLASGARNFDLINAGFFVGVAEKDWDLALTALRLKIKDFPEQAMDGWVKIGDIYTIEKKDEVNALIAYRNAMKLGTPQQQDMLRSKLPSAYLKKLDG